MTGQDRSLALYHPAVSFAYFLGMIACSMLVTHPVCLAMSLASSISCAYLFAGSSGMKTILRIALPMAAFAVLLNPLFSHEGATTIARFRNGNPLTLESILYGAAASAMLASVVFWFSAFNAVLTSDRIVFLFGRVSPALALLFSMTLRFASRFTRQMKELIRARRLAGLDGEGTTLRRKVRNGVSIFSAMVSWALESSVDTSDSMRSRGYGAGRRTAYAIYRWEARDTAAAAVLCALLLAFVTCRATGSLAWQYYPTVSFDVVRAIPALLTYALLCAFPLILSAEEAAKWRCLR